MALREWSCGQMIHIGDRSERVWNLWHFLRESDLDKREYAGHMREANGSGVKDFNSDGCPQRLSKEHTC